MTISRPRVHDPLTRALSHRTQIPPIPHLPPHIRAQPSRPRDRSRRLDRPQNRPDHLRSTRRSHRHNALCSPLRSVAFGRSWIAVCPRPRVLRSPGSRSPRHGLLRVSPTLGIRRLTSSADTQNCAAAPMLVMMAGQVVAAVGGGNTVTNQFLCKALPSSLLIGAFSPLFCLDLP